MELTGAEERERINRLSRQVITAAMRVHANLCVFGVLCGSFWHARGIVCLLVGGDAIGLVY
jgi:hypothetical protein